MSDEDIGLPDQDAWKTELPEPFTSDVSAGTELE